MTEDERGALVSAETLHRRGDPVAQLGAEEQAVLLRIAACCCHLRLLGIASAIPVNATARSKKIERAVDGDAMQPRSEVRALLESRQLPVRAQESLLHHIVGIV